MSSAGGRSESHSTSNYSSGGHGGHGDDRDHPFNGYYGGYQPYFSYPIMPMDMPYSYGDMRKVGMESVYSNAVTPVNVGPPLFFGGTATRDVGGQGSSRRRRADSYRTADDETDSGEDLSENGNFEKGEDTYGPYGANLFIFHLPSDLTNYQLYTLFCPFGKVLSVRIMINYYTGLSRGYGFVSYSSPEEAALAIKNMHGYALGRKRLKVQLKAEDLRRKDEWCKDMKQLQEEEEEKGEEDQEGRATPPSGLTSSATSLAGDEPLPSLDG